MCDRLTKISAMMLGMSLNFEKEILNIFMIFQQAYKLDELCVAKEDYRRLEYKSHRIYKLEQLTVAITTVAIVILTLIPFGNFYNNWIDSFLDMILLFFNATVVRSAISQNLTFFHKLYSKHRYEFSRHVKKDLP